MEAGSHQPRPASVERRSPPVPDSLVAQGTIGGTEATAAVTVDTPAAHHAARLVAGNAGDHMLVYALLRAANQTPSYEDFVTWLDEPTYEPSDRLLVKQDERILAHVQLLQRTAWFEGVKLPIGSLQDLAVLPEYADAGYEEIGRASCRE